MSKASEATQFPAQRNNSPLYRSPIREARILQRVIMQAAQTPKVAPSALAQLARAWSELEERKRILRMKPLPKAIDVYPKAKRGAPAAWSGPIEGTLEEVKKVEQQAKGSVIEGTIHGRSSGAELPGTGAEAKSQA